MWQQALARATVNNLFGISLGPLSGWSTQWPQAMHMCESFNWQWYLQAEVAMLLDTACMLTVRRLLWCLQQEQGQPESACIYANLWM